MKTTIYLEPEAQAFAAATATPPFIFNLGPAAGRAALVEAQSGPLGEIAVESEELDVAGGPGGSVAVRIVRPAGWREAAAALPLILYIHGAGWVFGDSTTHDRLVRELAVGAGAAVVFPNYSRAPEARYPTAIEECYAVLNWVAQEGAAHGIDPQRLAIAGDSAGGQIAAAVTLVAKERGGPCISLQLLFYPVTDGAFDTESYHQFGEGFFLRRDGMMWFWDQYTGSADVRNEITASPLRASKEQLAGLPTALVITAEADVLRDEGELYAAHLREAGVRVTTVRFCGIIHDFVMLNAMANTAAARGAIALATSWLRDGFARSS